LLATLALAREDGRPPGLRSAPPGDKLSDMSGLVGDAFPGIESLPDVCGGDPVVVRTRISVWVLEQARQHGLSEAAILDAYPTLRAEDLANAWAYVRSHRDEIQGQIRANEADDA
jgi:uncharacterized protein (DUF433 family)